MRDRQRTADGVRLGFERKNGLEQDIRALVERESRCCAFFRFDVNIGEDDIVLDVTCPADKGAYLDELYRVTDPHPRAIGALIAPERDDSREGDADEA